MASFGSAASPKAAELARMAAAVKELESALAVYAQTNGGSFTIFGSAARNELRSDSDIDILVDFPVEVELSAWLFAEAQAFEHNLQPDIKVRAWCIDRLLERIKTEGRVLT